MFNAQELNKRVDLLRATRVQDPELGGYTETWSVFGEAFAKVEPLVGREYFAAAAVQSENTVKFTIRHRPDLTPFDRLRYAGKDWEITSVINPKGRNRETLIMAKRLE